MKTPKTRTRRTCQRLLFSNAFGVLLARVESGNSKRLETGATSNHLALHHARAFRSLTRPGFAFPLLFLRVFALTPVLLRPVVETGR